jgi:hypothetical protein
MSQTHESQPEFHASPMDLEHLLTTFGQQHALVALNAQLDCATYPSPTIRR